MSTDKSPSGPDLADGIPLSELAEGEMLTGHVGEDAVLLARSGGDFHAVGAHCTHYGAPLGDGLIVDDSVRCPWHHACFSLRSGEALAAPALDGLACWKTEVVGDRVHVRERADPAPARRPARSPSSVVIVGGGAAGEAAAEMLRREGYTGPVTILSEEAAPPCDRPNLSKDYLAGTAKAAWIPLRGDDFYARHDITLRLATAVAVIEPKAARLRLADGEVLGYGALLLATGAEPVRLAVPGAELPHVHTLRSQTDSEALIAAVEAGARHAVVIGASFIGLEVAASLRQRGLEVRVVAPEAHPLERVLGEKLSDFIRGLHESKGVIFHLEERVASISADMVELEGGERLDADLVVAGIGVLPRTALAEAAGLKVDNGVWVSDTLETSVSGIYAAGDIACGPDPLSGERVRIEHWTVAQRQGQRAARNILGAEDTRAAVPFFWSQHYDIGINYVGHATHWDRIETDGAPAAHDFTARFIAGGHALAVATIFRDRESLEAEAKMEARIRSR
ncbi:3-phenylpropionate/trans-cinnamate dioxygenase ferredoxin reductase subunit [Onishia taeanensis]|uniref:3-phenylpropionate/trans-cinnamate dioxygenase ferredoxin reductase subunit n=3 Tax=Onishia taeanensis TaxID=284577 RepID=A0A328XN75_9GAMM|nr:FAD-dependent oxidoreductase [Halomonas taeanensis]RAR59818.1 3-phenylpropionate/trans-cinnamate dioxygenase ferredoxin reductase subunit [Halomonas taeanensis]